METELAEALRAIDEALAGAPQRNGEAFSKALAHFTQARGALYARDRRTTEPGRQQLDRINASISIVLAGHFPLGEPPWEELRKLRGWLQEVDSKV